MKYTLATLAALTLMATAASADMRFPCTKLTANWNQAPELQCGRIVSPRGPGYQAPTVGVPAPTPPAIPETPLASVDEPIIG